MENLLHWWLAVWLYVIAAMGIAVTVMLIVKWENWSWLNRIGALAIIVLVFHVWEEWVFPGGFHVIYNLASAYPDRYPMSELTDMITNFSGVVLGCIVLFIWGFKNEAGIAIMLFSGFEVFIHIRLAFQSKSVFGPLGQNIIYAPGMVTALLGFLPVFVGLVVYFVKHKPRPNLRHWVVGILATVSLSFLCVNLPELILKDVNSPYPFPDNGYYEQFVKSDALN